MLCAVDNSMCYLSYLKVWTRRGCFRPVDFFLWLVECTRIEIIEKAKASGFLGLWGGGGGARGCWFILSGDLIWV